MSWAPEDGHQVLENDRDGDSSVSSSSLPYLTKQAGKIVVVNHVRAVVEWTVPGLPVLTVPLLIGIDEADKPIAVSLLGCEEKDDLPVEGPFNLFCRSSCYISCHPY